MINFVDYETYINYQMQFGRNDVDWTVAGFGMQSPRFKGPQTITVKNGGNAYEGEAFSKCLIMDCELGSRKLNGSSRTSTCGWCSIAEMIPIFCLLPAE